MLRPMLDAIQNLLTLQDKDQRLVAYRTERDAIPREIQTKQRLTAEAAGRLDAAKTRAKEIEVAKKSLQVEAGSKREQSARYKTQQMQTRKNEEFTALAHEITGTEKAINAIEDQELALMEEAETLKPVIAEADKTFASEKQKYEAQIVALESKTVNLAERITELEAARKACVIGIDVDILERYERLFQTKNGQVVVALENLTCTGCHMKVTTQASVELKADKHIVSCPQCGRILHLPA